MHATRGGLGARGAPGGQNTAPQRKKQTVSGGAAGTPERVKEKKWNKGKVKKILCKE